MRPLALLLLIFALAAGLFFVLNAGGQAGADGPPTLTPDVDPEPAHGATGPGPAPIEVGTERGSEPGADRAAAGPKRSFSAIAADGLSALDVIVLDRSGGALLGAAGSLPLSDQAWVRLFLGSGAIPTAQDPLSGLNIVDLPEPRRRTSQRKGWVTAIDPPGGDAYIALAFGESVVCAVAVPPGASEAEVVAGIGDFDGVYASIEGSLAGMIEASRLVRIRPEISEAMGAVGSRLSFGRVPHSIAVQGEGDRFTAKRLPPGLMTVMVRAEATALGPALHAAKTSRGLSALSMGARVPNMKQWELRLDVMRRLQLPVADIPVLLAPGEHRQLGSLSTDTSAAVVLEFIDASGRPVDATSVDVMLLAVPGVQEESPLTWTYENSASLFPLLSRPSELMVVQGDLGALVKVTPEPLRLGAPITTRTVRLERLSVIKLPTPRQDTQTGTGAAAAQLSTVRGRRVRIDPRWLGSRYCGHEIRGRTLAVPTGAYIFEEAGSRRIIEIGAGEFIDASSGTPGPASKLTEDQE